MPPFLWLTHSRKEFLDSGENQSSKGMASSTPRLNERQSHSKHKTEATTTPTERRPPGTPTHGGLPQALTYAALSPRRGVPSSRQNRNMAFSKPSFKKRHWYGIRH